MKTRLQENIEKNKQAIKSHLKELKKAQNIRIAEERELRANVFNGEKLFGNIVRTKDGRYFQILVKFGRKYEKSNFVEINKEEVEEKRLEHERTKNIVNSLISFEKEKGYTPKLHL